MYSIVVKLSIIWLFYTLLGVRWWQISFQNSLCESLHRLIISHLHYSSLMGDVGYLKCQLWYGNKTIHYHYHHYHCQLSLVNTFLFWQTKQRNKISMIFCSWAMATWFDKQIGKDIRSVWYFAHGQWQFDGFPWRPIAVPALQRHQVRAVNKC